MKSIIEIFQEAKNMDVDNNAEHFILLEDSQLKPIKRILGSFGLTQPLKNHYPTFRFIDKQREAYILKELVKNVCWLTYYNPNTKTLSSTGMRTLKSEYVNITISRKIKKAGFSVPKSDTVFLSDYPQFNQSLTTFLRDNDLSSKTKDPRFGGVLKPIISKDLMDYILNSLMKDEIFREKFTK